MRVKIPKPLCGLLEKDVPFDFSECIKAFEELKKLITAPIIMAQY